MRCEERGRLFEQEEFSLAKNSNELCDRFKDIIKGLQEDCSPWDDIGVKRRY